MATHPDLLCRLRLSHDAQGSEAKKGEAPMGWNWMRRIQTAFPCAAWEREGNERENRRPEACTLLPSAFQSGE